MPILNSVIDNVPIEAWNEPAIDGRSKGKTPLWNVMKSAAMPEESNPFFKLIAKTKCRGLNFDIHVNGVMLIDRLFAINREILAMILILRPDISSDCVSKETADFINAIKDVYGEIVKGVCADIAENPNAGDPILVGKPLYLAYMGETLKGFVNKIPPSLYQMLIDESYDKNIRRLLDNSSDNAEEADSLLDCTTELKKLTINSRSHKPHLRPKRK